MAAPSAPTNLRIVTDSGKTLLQPTDITYLGMFRTPNDPSGTRFGFSGAHISGRRVGNDIQLFMTGSMASGSPQPLYEISYPGYHTSFASAPVATLVHDWGDIYENKRVTGNNSDKNTRGIHWDGTYLWWAYGDSYNTAGYWDPSVGCTKLNSNGTINSYGPWRAQIHSQKARGYMVGVPDWFKTQYNFSASVAVGSPITSGNSASPWGPCLYGITDFDPTTRAADTLEDSNKSLLGTTMMLNDLDHPMTRDQHYYIEGWEDYPTNEIPFRNNGTIYFGGLSAPGGTGSGLDMMTSAVWIDTTTKSGILMLGAMVHKPTDAEPYAAVWYGPQTGPYGEVDNTTWEATGPGCSYFCPYQWIFDPSDIGEVLGSAKQVYEVTPASTTSMYSIYEKSVGMYFQGGAWFDPTSSLLFIATRFEDGTTNSYEPRPIVRVFQVS